MSVLDQIKAYWTPEKPKKKTKANHNVHIEQLDRAKASIENWRQALTEWEDVDYPDRTNLVRHYQEMLMDDAIAGFVDSLTNRLLASDLHIINNDQEVEAGGLFDEMWFEALVKNFVIAELVGFRLVELTPQAGKIPYVGGFYVFPDHYIVPQCQKIMRSESNFNSMIDYRGYLSNLVELGDHYDKGLLNSIAPLYIYKKNALGYWSIFQSKYGIPPVIGKTDLTAEGAAAEMFTYLENLRSNTVAVIDRDDEIEPLSVSTADGFNTYLEMIKHVDTAMIRRLEGQNMTSQEGSSMAQAVVHERTGDNWFYGRLNKLLRMLNSQVAPILQRAGMLREGDTFAQREQKQIDKMIDRITKLSMARIEVDADYVEEETGIKLAEYAAAPDMQEDTKTVANDLKQLYNSL